MPPGTREQLARPKRIQLVLTGHREGSPSHRELTAFATYCIARVERDLGEITQWCVHIAPVHRRFTSTVAIIDGTYRAQAVGMGHDGVLAIWNAMCRIEETLRELRARRSDRDFDVS